MIGRTVRFVVLVAVTAIFLVPTLWGLSVSFQSTSERQRLPLTLIPSRLDWDNYRVALEAAPLLTYLWHTVFIVVLVTVGSVSSAALVAYGLARLRFVGREFWFNVILSTMMIPFVVTLIPLYLMFKSWGWLDTFAPLIVPAFFGGGPFNIFLMRQFILTIPPELDEAAEIDGASKLRTFVSIVLPMTKPALAVTGWMTAVAAWSDFTAPLIFLPSSDNWTLSLALFAYPKMIPPGYAGQPVVAIAVIAVLPVIIGFVFVQRLLIEGINLSGVNR